MPRSLALRTLVIVALAAIPAATRAQSCLGNPSFSTNHLQLAGNTQVAERATSFGAAIGSGSETVFGVLRVGGVTYDDFDGSTVQVGGTLGYQVTAPTIRSFQMCPVFSAAYGMGPKDVAGSGNDQSTTSFSFGLSAGGELIRTRGLSLIPAPSIAFVYTSSAVDALGGSARVSDTYGLVGLTLGVVFNSQLSVRPSVAVPFGIESRDPVYGIGVTLNYGGRR